LPEELPACLRPINLKHRLVDDRHPHNNNNKGGGGPITTAAGGNNKDLYGCDDDEHERPLLDATETESLDLSHLSVGGGDIMGSGGGDGGIAVSTTANSELAVNSPESLLSSPGRPQPVKFDFNAVDAVVKERPPGRRSFFLVYRKELRKTDVFFYADKPKKSSSKKR
jgi:hypothetical protein